MYETDGGFDDWMRGHMRWMRELMRLQNAHIQALRQLIESQQVGTKSQPSSSQKPRRRLQDSEAVEEAVEGLAKEED